MATTKAKGTTATETTTEVKELTAREKREQRVRSRMKDDLTFILESLDSLTDRRLQDVETNIYMATNIILAENANDLARARQTRGAYNPGY